MRRKRAGSDETRSLFICWSFANENLHIFEIEKFSSYIIETNKERIFFLKNGWLSSNSPFVVVVVVGVLRAEGARSPPLFCSRRMFLPIKTSFYLLFSIINPSHLKVSRRRHPWFKLFWRWTTLKKVSNMKKKKKARIDSQQKKHKIYISWRTWWCDPSVAVAVELTVVVAKNKNEFTAKKGLNVSIEIGEQDAVILERRLWQW